MLLLATTALEWSWGSAEPLLFLGEWCKRYERRCAWEPRRPVVVPYHWDDRAKLKRDHVYLRGLHDELLRELARVLGEHHDLERPLRFWQVLLDPWLSRYLGVVFDRWECLRLAFESCGASHSIVSDREPAAPVRDQGEFLTAVTNDPWNHELCADIIAVAYAARCDVRRSSCSPQASADAQVIDLAGRTRSRLWHAVSRAEQLFSYGSPRNDVVLVHPYFPFGSFLRLNMRLRQVPRLYLREFAWPQEFSRLPFESSPLRRTLLPSRSGLSAFENFVRQRMARDIPQVFLELFARLSRRSAKLRLRPKLILTANDHANNDVFKNWAAHKTHEGVPLTVIDHGGALPPLFGAMKCEDEIADARAIWQLPWHPKHVRLPCNKLVGRRRLATPGTRLLVIGQEMPRYAFDSNSMPLAGQTLYEFEHVCQLHDALASGPQSAFLVKPNLDMGWRTRERYLERLGAEKVCHEPRLERVWSCARMVVSTYPQTNFSEAMYIGVPAVLVYSRDLYETVPHLEPLLLQLSQARIAFFDPHEAASHINAVWDAPVEWWESVTVKAARSRFQQEAVDVRADWVEPWVDFIRRQLPAERLSALAAKPDYAAARRKES